jgi:hypothetical protein
MMMLYIAEVYGKIKPGISKNPKSRILSYDRGNNNPMIHYLYVADEGYDEHIKNCENHLTHQLLEYFENPNGSHKPSEYIDPVHTHVTAKYVSKIVSKRIKSHPLKIKRVKDVFLPIDRYNVATLLTGIKNFPNKYLEDV